MASLRMMCDWLSRALKDHCPGFDLVAEMLPICERLRRARNLSTAAKKAAEQQAQSMESFVDSLMQEAEPAATGAPKHGVALLSSLLRRPCVRRPKHARLRHCSYRHPSMPHTEAQQI